VTDDPTRTALRVPPAAQCSLTGRAFLVQLAANADPADGVFCGRVERLRTGDAAHFTSLDDLAGFFAEALGSPE
jgi:hypothetical protein